MQVLLGLAILKYVLMRVASATFMLSLVAGQSALMLPPDATDHLLTCLPQPATCTAQEPDSSPTIAEEEELPPR